MPMVRPLADIEGPLWHYSRFKWVEKEPWCGTYLFYCSPSPTGPLYLYPLHKEGTLRNTPPGETDDAFHPHYVKLDVQSRIPEGLAVLRVRDLHREVSMALLLHPQWPSFAEFCEQHGLRRPDAQYFLDVGMEKALIPVLHFFPLFPVVGFAYDHTFSTVPEPHTLCLTVASSLLIPHIGTPEGDDLLAVARACWEGSTEEDLERLENIPYPTLANLFTARHYGITDPDLPDFIVESISRPAVRYFAKRRNGDTSHDNDILTKLLEYQ
eukprot:Sspe_Gene.23449::Locus_9104_Transcript_1_1_Confidence_1.000_Length_1192::g.23449::m.23449